MGRKQTFAEFESEALSRGFDEVLVREWAPRAVVEDHAHPFGVHAIVVQGEMWLDCGEGPKHLVPGDTFELEPDKPHTEHYGDAGATYWVARRNK